MIYFDKTFIYQFTAPSIRRLLFIVKSPVRLEFWCRIIISALIVQIINLLADLFSRLLGPADDFSPGFYALLLTESIRYGGWLWSIWYGILQILLFPSSRNKTGLPLPAPLLSCTVTSGFLMFILVELGQTVDPNYLLLIRGMFLAAYGFSVLLPTLSRPTTLT